MECDVLIASIIPPAGENGNLIDLENRVNKKWAIKDTQRGELTPA